MQSRAEIEMIRKTAFWVVSIVWGGIITFCGIVVALILICLGYQKQYFGMFVYFEVGKNWGGINLGPIFIVNKNPSLHILKHEAGHGIQNARYGFFMLPLVAIPSVSRVVWRKLISKWSYIKLPPYESIWFEKQATEWGYKITRTRWNL